MSYAIVTSDNDYLVHHGITGMKWGVRRYQNEDGSLTDKGKLKYYKTSKGKFKKINRRSNYKKSEAYNNASEEEQKMMRDKFKAEKRRYGTAVAKKAAAVRTNGIDTDNNHYKAKEVVKETGRSALISAASTVANMAAVPVATLAASAIAQKRYRDSLTKIGAKKLVHVGGNVYKYV